MVLRKMWTQITFIELAIIGNYVVHTPLDNQQIKYLKLQKMQITYPVHQSILQKVQELKQKINTKEFCELHGISESKFSRFPSKKFMEELELLDYMLQFCE